MREPLTHAIWKIEHELVSNWHINKLSDVKEAIDKLEIIIEKAKRLIK